MEYFELVSDFRVFREPIEVFRTMTGGSPTDVVRHMVEQRLDFPVLNDADGRISAAWGVHAVLASFSAL